MMECFSFLDSIVKIDNKTAEISTESLQEAARHQRSIDKLKELSVKATRGEKIDEDEIPPAPPGFQDNKKAVGGMLRVRVRVREPLGDTKLAIRHEKWLVLDN
ncbi:unnamed protein product, partial [Mesorhabditis belari]|uniref:DM14 domain-containing protein n=1 Tax=Mesorhabditis belari TaxID=2138241 RepID=A0AAF3EFZ5_9BILA